MDEMRRRRDGREQGEGGGVSPTEEQQATSTSPAPSFISR